MNRLIIYEFLPKTEENIVEYHENKKAVPKPEKVVGAAFDQLLEYYMSVSV